MCTSRSPKSRSFAFVICLLFVATIHAQTHFPDECNDQLQIRSAWPEEGSLRFWIKGSAAYPSLVVTDENGQTLAAQVALQPPYYTTVIKFPRRSGEMVVTATGPNSTKLVKRVSLTPGMQMLPSSGEDFSILAYGCIEPFEVDPVSKKAIVDISGHPPGSAMYKAFAKLASRNSAHQLISTSMDSTAFIESGLKANNAPLAARSPVIIATGDQVYVDAGYGTNPKKFKNQSHPLSAWEAGCRRPMPLPYMTPPRYVEHLDNMYRAFGSFNELESLFESVPQVNIWDDHEIRDGWGSQGDEYKNGLMNPVLEPYFTAAKRACLDHQIALGPKCLEPDPYSAGKTMDRTFQLAGIKCFAFDLRTERNYLAGEVFGKAQWERFLHWCSSDVEQCDTILLISSIPVFYFNNKTPWSWAHTPFGAGDLDDVRDSWIAPMNQKEHNDLVREMIRLRLKKNVTILVLSGDLHKGAISEAWFNLNPVRKNDGRFRWKDTSSYSQKRLLAVELTTTGLYHAEMTEKLKANIYKSFDAVRNGSSYFGVALSPDSTYTIDPMVRWSRVQQNFGYFEFTKEGGTVNIVFGHDKEARAFLADKATLGPGPIFQTITVDLDFKRDFAQEWKRTSIAAEQKAWNTVKPHDNYRPAWPEKMTLWTLDE